MCIRIACQTRQKPQQECIPVGCVPPADWPSLGEGGVCVVVVVVGVLARYPPGRYPHWQVPPRQVPPPGRYTPLGRSPPAGTPPGQVHPPRQVHPPWQVHPPVNRMTNWCKNITLPQTSFAGGKKYIWVSLINLRRMKENVSPYVLNISAALGFAYTCCHSQRFSFRLKKWVEYVVLSS